MQTKRAHNVRPLPYQTEKHNYLNFAETKSEKLKAQSLSPPAACRQAP